MTRSTYLSESKDTPQNQQSDSDKPLPRPPRTRHRGKSERGLPLDQELAGLASTFLSYQRQHWPELVAANLLPEVSEPVLMEMVDDFKIRHRSGQVDTAVIEPFFRLCHKLAGDYSRYSCDNSNPRSIIDQMVNALEKARAEKRFIPWQYVFADYSVSGLSSPLKNHILRRLAF